MVRQQTRGQVTIWIILGILLLISLSIVAVIFTQQQERRVEDAIVVPNEIQPFYDFNRNCLQTITKQGLVKIGLQGGFNNVPFSISRTPDSFVPVGSGGVIKIPLWFYDGEERTPPLEFINRELAIYIQDNMPACLNDFAAFEDIDVVEKSDMIPRITISEDNILVVLDWTLDVQFADGRTINVPSVVSRSDVKFGEIYNLATQTMNAVNQGTIFENLTIDLMAMHPDIPMDGLEVSCVPQRWPLLLIKEDLQELLKYNIPQARIQDTAYVPFSFDESVYEDLRDEREQILQALEAGAENPTYPENTPDDAYYYFRMNFDVGAEHPDLKAGFEYLPEWGLSIDAEPRDGGVLRSNLVQGERSLLSFVCINQYHFTYDVSYPLVMHIRDEEAFGGEGYNFQFAFPVLIDNNFPRRDVRGRLQFDTDFADYSYCSKLGGDVVELRANGFESGVPFAIPLDGAEMVFNCGIQQCELGTTGADEGEYRLRTAMPEGCGNPSITAKKEGYLPDRQTLFSAIDTELDLELIKLKEMNLEIVKHRYFKVDDRLENSSEPLRDSESALVFVSVKNRTVPFEQYIEIGQDEANLPNMIQLGEENLEYDITVFISDAFGNLIGGYTANDFEITYDEILGSDTVTFHALVPSAIPDNDLARAETMGLIFGDRFSQTLRPTFT